jgi:predicted NBD/HSP70 family sugar kinase
VGEDIVDFDDLLQRANSGNGPAAMVLTRAGRLLGREIANVVNILDPKLILISGEGVRMGEIFFSALRAAYKQHVMPGLLEDTEIRVIPWGDDVWARAAASVVIGELFNSPMQKEEGIEKGR